jgi:hypothetical protein
VGQWWLHSSSFLQTIKMADGVIQEALLILAGHGSSSKQLLAGEEEDHPNPALRLITSIAEHYTLIKQHTTTTTQTNNNNNNNNPAITALNTAINNQLLKHYQLTLISLEHSLLTHHPSLVPANQDHQPAPPLTAITAQLNHYQLILLNLTQLINQTHTHQPSSTTTQLIQLIHNHQASTGSPGLAEILNKLQLAIEQLWINQFRAFIIHQQQEDHQQLFQFDNQLKQFSFHPDGLPILPSLEPIHSLQHTINQICHAISILNNLLPSNTTPRTRTRLPQELQAQLTHALQSIHSISNPQFRIAVKNIQGLFLQKITH